MYTGNVDSLPLVRESLYIHIYCAIIHPLWPRATVYDLRILAVYFRIRRYLTPAPALPSPWPSLSCALVLTKGEILGSRMRSEHDEQSQPRGWAEAIMGGKQECCSSPTPFLDDILVGPQS